MFEMIEDYDVQKERKKVRKERDIEIAVKMLKKGMDIKDIIDIIGLSKEKLEKIKMDIEH